MILSDEPGYYEDGKFGIRIENIVKIVPADTKHNFQGTGTVPFKFQDFPEFIPLPAAIPGTYEHSTSDHAFNCLSYMVLLHTYVYLQRFVDPDPDPGRRKSTSK